MITTIFLPTFFKTLAITCGIGGGLIALFSVAVLLLFAVYPITQKIHK